MAGGGGQRWAVLVAGAMLVLGLAVLLGGERPAGPAPRSSEDPSARCELTPGAAAQATIVILNRAYGPAVAVSAGQAVAFRSQDATAHTVTEGVAGHAADNACARQRLPPRQSTAVTFHRPGDYRFTCTIHASMQTVVHVR